jgi:hypothetical protein
MRNPTHKQRRSRTFRVEVLESRELLSTAGIVSRTAAAAAPLARVAQVSGIPAEKTVLEGSLKGTGTASDGKANVTATGDVPQLGESTLSLKATYSGAAKSGEGNEFKKGTATLTNGVSSVSVSFEWENHPRYAFFLKGTAKGETGAFAKMKGKFSGVGKFLTYTAPDNFSISITIELTKK